MCPLEESCLIEGVRFLSQSQYSGDGKGESCAGEGWILDAAPVRLGF